MAEPSGNPRALKAPRRRDLIGERWLRFWKSRRGRWAARLAGLGVKPAAAAHASVSPFTESGAASAAARWFQDMPEEVHEVLEDLPNALLGLHMQGRRLRKWLDGLESEPAALRDTAPVLLEERTTAQRRLTESGAALEAIQLELRRLRDGTGSVESVTAQLRAAQEIAGAVDRMLDGPEDASSALAGPEPGDRSAPRLLRPPLPGPACPPGGARAAPTRRGSAQAGPRLPSVAKATGRRRPFRDRTQPRTRSSA